MDNNNRTHPLVIAAAVAVLLSSALAVAVLTGVMPSANSGSAPESALATGAASPAQRTGPASAASRPLARRAACDNCGVIESIQPVESSAPTSGIGAVAGGVTGAVVGNQFGRGSGRTAMTLLGAAGGALAGNAIEKNTRKQTSYRVVLRMDDGSRRTLIQAALPAAGVGERVRVSGDSSLERVS